MVMISSEARARIEPYGQTIRRVRQRGIPFDIPIGVPILNPFVRKQMRFKARYRLRGLRLEDVREGIMFGDFTSFMDMKLEEFSREKRTRHFKLNPFTKKMEEVLGGKLGRLGVRIGHNVAAFMVRMLGLVEWHVAEEPVTGPDLVTIHVDVNSRFFGGHFKFRIHREADGVIVDDDWLPEGGGEVIAASLPMSWLVLKTHPLGFEQIVERVTDEIVGAQKAGRPYTGELTVPTPAPADTPDLRP